MACKEVGKEFLYGQCLRMQPLSTQPYLTTLLKIAQLLSVDMKELITDETERTTI